MNKKEPDQTFYTGACFFIVLVVWVIVVCAQAKPSATKLTKEQLVATVTNLDAVIPGAGKDTQVCVLVWKGKNTKGEANESELKIGQFRSVHFVDDTVFYDGTNVLTWGKACLDTSYGEWKIYAPSIQTWKYEKVIAYRYDSLNRYVIDMSKVSKAKSDSLKSTVKVTTSLGSITIKKEALP